MDLTSHPPVAENSTVETDTQDTFIREAETYMTFKVAKLIDNYYFPVLIPLGLVGNTLSFLVMMKPNNNRMSTCIYMAALSINDNLMMCSAFHFWLVSAVNIHVWNYWECVGSVYFAYYCLQTATYQVLVMTVDKYVAIKWPHKAVAFSTPKRAKIIIATIITCVIIYNLPHLFMTEVIQEECYGFSVKSTITKVYSWLSFVLNAIIPFTLLIHMNYTIINTVRISHKMFRGNFRSTGTETLQKARQTTENQLTTMLLLVTTLFLLLLLPTYVRFIYSAFVTSETPSKFADSLLIFEISYKLYVTNSGINFFLYCVSGERFRNDLKEIVCYNKPSLKVSSKEPNILSIIS